MYNEKIEIFCVLVFAIAIIAISIKLTRENFADFTVNAKKQISNPYVSQFDQMVTFPKNQKLNRTPDNYRGDYLEEMYVLRKNNPDATCGSVVDAVPYPQFSYNPTDFYKF